MSKLRTALFIAIAAFPLHASIAGPRAGHNVCTAKRPVACPGGGVSECIDGAWRCKPLETEAPKVCAPAKRPAACPGGGVASCTDGEWLCKPLPRK